MNLIANKKSKNMNSQIFLSKLLYYWFMVALRGKPLTISTFNEFQVKNKFEKNNLIFSDFPKWSDTFGKHLHYDDHRDKRPNNENDGQEHCALEAGLIRVVLESFPFSIQVVSVRVGQILHGT